MKLQEKSCAVEWNFDESVQQTCVYWTGSAAEFGGVQIGDRLVTINGTNVIKAKESTVIDLVIQSEFNWRL